MIKIFDLFAGVGGFRVGAEKVFKKNQLDFEFTGWSEIDKYCQVTYKANFNTNNEFFVDDIKKITSYNKIDCNINNFTNKNRSTHIKKHIPKFDLLFAGFPCQSFSKMGNQNSLNDERGALFFDIAAILHSIKPKYFILENVNRILTIDNKKTIMTIMNTLEKLGYKTDLFKLDSKDWCSQTRRRVFIYGYKELDIKVGLPNPKIIKVQKQQKYFVKEVNPKYILSKKILKQYLVMERVDTIKNQK